MKNRTHFHAYGLGGEDKHGPNDNPPMYTLETLMKQNGHTHIDLLKIDIEGWEFDTLTTLIKPYVTSGRPLPFGQLSIEIHIWNKTFAQFLSWWEMLEAAGLRPFWTEPNLVYQNYNRKTGTADLAEVCIQVILAFIVSDIPLVHLPQHQGWQRLHQRQASRSPPPRPSWGLDS